MSETKPGFFAENRRSIVLVALAGLVFVIYFQTTRFDFINLDDNLYIFGNDVTLSGLNKESIRWAFSQFYAANWHPLTWLSHMLDIELFGQNPGAHHATNVVFHVANTLLAFTVFREMTGSFWRSSIIAALFAVHPAHVESVAWVAERKDVLSTFFWLLTMLAYASYAKRVAADDQTGLIKRVGPAYLLVFVLFALGLMAKPMLVTLPCVLLLLDLWPLGRLNSPRDIPRLVIEKIPLFALSAASSYITFLAQRAGGSVESLDYLPIGTRAVNALLSVGKYTAMLFYPANLGIWYPYDRNFPTSQVVVSAIFFVAMTALCIWQFNRRKYLTVGWLWFLGTLVPVIGLVQVGAQPMADRYTYVPYFGLFIILVWGLADLFKTFSLPKLAYFGILGAFIVVLTPIAFIQTAYWRNNEILYKRTLAVTEKNFLISHNLCHHLAFSDRLVEAEPYCQMSIADNPKYYEAYNTYGILLFKRGEYASAEEKFKQALELRGDYAIVYSNLAQAQILQNRPEDAEESLRRAAILSSPSSAGLLVGALGDLAVLYARQDKFDMAANSLKRLLYLAPENLDAKFKLALVSYRANRFEESQATIEAYLKARPDDADAYSLLGMTLASQKKNDLAKEAFEKALAIKPDLEEAKQNLKRLKGER